MSDNYKFSYAEKSVYACAIKLIVKYCSVGSVHIDLGCGHAPIASELQKLGIKYVGFDTNESVVHELTMLGIEAYKIDLLNPDSAIEDIFSVLNKSTISTISMLDVIEHLDFDCAFLSAIRSKFIESDNVYIILSVPNFSHIDVATKLIGGDWEYTKTGLLDNTHRVVFTENHLAQITRLCGWQEIDRCDYHLEYSDQYFLRPKVILNRSGGIGKHIRQIKGGLDENSDIHQFVRAFRPASAIDLDRISSKNQQVLIALIILDRSKFDAVLDLFSHINEKNIFTQFEIIVEQSVGRDISDFDFYKLMSLSPLLRVVRLSSPISEKETWLKINAKFWMCFGGFLEQNEHYLCQVVSVLLKVNDCPVLHIRPINEKVCDGVVESSNIQTVMSLPSSPFGALIIPTDYVLQFNDFPSEINDSDYWYNYIIKIGIRVGVSKVYIDYQENNNFVSVSAKFSDMYIELLSMSELFFLIHGTVDPAIENYQKKFQQLDITKMTKQSESQNAIKQLEEKIDLVVKLTKTQQSESQIAIKQLEDRLGSIVKSTSWRITAPLRYIGQGIKLVRHLVLNGVKRNTIRIYIIEFIPRFRILRYFWKVYVSWRLRLRGACNSSSNLLSLQALSERRSSCNFIEPPDQFIISDNLPEIDISIVAFNSERWVASFLSSLKCQEYPLSKINIIVIDHGSFDGTLSLFNNYFAENGSVFASARVIQQNNSGFGGGHNRAICESNSKYLLVANLDIEFAKDSISQVVYAALADKTETVASWEFRQIPFEHPKYYDPVTLETNWSSHACILLRRSAYNLVGGYDPAIFMYAEDVELSYRFRSYGFRLMYVPRAVITHFTYESESQIKPLQFSGSTIGNVYLRLRYGNWQDRISGAMIYSANLLQPEPFVGAKKLLISNIFSALIKTPHFLRGKGKSKAYFPFRGFDYEMIRDGAFWNISPCISRENCPLVTIITRTYKGRGFLLRQAIKSVFNQTYSNIELLVIEDGGVTQQALVSKMAADEANGFSVRFIANEKLGRSAAGNRGLAAAKGDFIMFLDDDDLLFADHVETLMSVLINSPSLSAAYSLAIEIHTRVMLTEERYIEESFHTHEIFRQKWDYEILKHHNFIPIQSIIFSRNLYVNFGGFDPALDQLEDWNLWLRYGYNNQFFYVPKTTSLYRVPAEMETRLNRATELDSAYDDAKKRAKKSINERAQLCG